MSNTLNQHPDAFCADNKSTKKRVLKTPDNVNELETAAKPRLPVGLSKKRLAKDDVNKIKLRLTEYLANSKSRAEALLSLSKAKSNLEMDELKLEILKEDIIKLNDNLSKIPTNPPVDIFISNILN